MNSVIHIGSNDNVAVAIQPVEKGQILTVDGLKITALEDIKQGHKIAVKAINKGENIIKYGFPIGHALVDIKAGEWVHTHNAKTNLSGEVTYSYHPSAIKLPTGKPLTFQGFQRADGKVGIRNEIWIIPTVGCVNDIAEKLARDNRDLVQGTVEGIHAFTHPFGCSQTGKDHAQTRKLLAALAKHPNAGAVLVVSLGCENLTHEQFLEELGDFDKERILFMTCQEENDELAKGRELLKKCIAFAGNFHRQELSSDKLIVGMKCGGSDGLSGITANPVVGKFSDLLLAQGGSTILTEVPEMFGAEGMLMNRCINEQVFQKAAHMLNGFKDYFIAHHEVVYDNPSPGNKAGGITTLEDKSCGCVQKGGTAPIVDVINYAEQVTKHGLTLLYGPGNDLVSCTALTAAGAQLILFTTGRGTPFGAPVPTLKISSNTNLAAKKANWIDFNAGVVATGDSIDSVGKQLLQLVIAVASGKQAKNEINEFRGISIFKDGVVL
ncbi:MAG: altronate dehydratase family protein [Acidaminococcaceae bacterium]|jgi:altronate hydrolase|nr:altronate dehydratase family protein [Acidaminococcaceae bacterium]